MPTVFISHSSRDIRTARRLRADLEQRGAVVWLDETEIRVGDSISEKIQLGLGVSDFVLVLLSRQSAASGWEKKEWQSVMSLEARTGRTIVLPVKIDDCEVPPLFADKRHADLHANYPRGLEEILLALRLSADSLETCLSLDEAQSYERGLDKYRASDCFVRNPEFENAIRDATMPSRRRIAAIASRAASDVEPGPAMTSPVISPGRVDNLDAIQGRNRSYSDQRELHVTFVWYPTFCVASRAHAYSTQCSGDAAADALNIAVDPEFSAPLDRFVLHPLSLHGTADPVP